MFVALTPIDEVTGNVTGNPIWTNKLAAIATLERVSAAASNVDHTRVTFIGDEEVLVIKETPEEILPKIIGAIGRE